jgi:hypothetical protein
MIYSETLTLDIYVIAAVTYVVFVEFTRLVVSRLALYLTRHKGQASIGPESELRLIMQRARESSG